MATYPKAIQDLPITEHLDSICQTLKDSPSRILILTAETGAGKSTALPLALLKHFDGKIAMLEPRRLAATAVAARVANLLDEEVGQTSGYTVHLDSKTGKQTRFTVMTDGVFVKQIQSDPFLEGVNVVVLDEFHERSLQSDLSLAFLRQTMQARDDLYLVIMSATIDAKAISAELNAQILQIPGKLYPVQVEFEPSKSVTSAIINEITNARKSATDRSVATKTEENYRKDTILVFLPGIYEIRKVQAELQEKLSDNSIDIKILHSSISLAEQKEVLNPVPQNLPQRVILSSAIAETSLTVPGVNTVIDSGWMRLNRINPRLSMQTLVTERVSLFNAQQRTGRAGRLGPGRCIRLWDKNEVLVKQVDPEILRSDLTPCVLECAQWSSAAFGSLEWLTPPQPSAWNSAVNLLEGLGLLKNNKITSDGKVALSLPLHPRFAAALIFALKSGKKAEGVGFVSQYAEQNNLSPKQIKKFKAELNSKIDRLTISTVSSMIKSYSRAKLLLAGFPDRLGLKTDDKSSKEGSTYQFVSGRKAFLAKNPSQCPEWIIATDVDAGQTTGRIYAFESINENEIQDYIQTNSKETTRVYFEGKSDKIKKVKIRSLGAIILNETPLQVDADDFAKAIINSVKENGLDSIEIDARTKTFLMRSIFYAQKKSHELFTRLENLSSNAEEWLLPFITSNKLQAQTIYDALYYYLKGQEIDSNVPEILVLSNGKKAKIHYQIQNSGDNLTIDSLLTTVRTLKIQPTLEIIIQQIFGCLSNPTVLGEPVLLKLLSPARRPLQITTDLAGFWDGAWIEICKEMKGRYPKHNWDYRLVQKD